MRVEGGGVTRYDNDERSVVVWALVGPPFWAVAAVWLAVAAPTAVIAARWVKRRLTGTSWSSWPDIDQG